MYSSQRLQCWFLPLRLTLCEYTCTPNSMHECRVWACILLHTKLWLQAKSFSIQKGNGKRFSFEVPHQKNFNNATAQSTMKIENLKREFYTFQWKAILREKLLINIWIKRLCIRLHSFHGVRIGVNASV